MHRLYTIAAALAVAGLLATTLAAAGEEKTPGYNHKIPEKIMTPDAVETRFGTMKFFDGMPDKATVERLYDNLDVLRGVETFLNGVPATSIEGLRLGHLDLGADTSNKVILLDQLMDSAPLFLTSADEDE